MEHVIKITHWKKDMKIKCPECGKKVKEPYKCKCGAVIKLRMDMKF